MGGGAEGVLADQRRITEAAQIAAPVVPAFVVAAVRNTASSCGSLEVVREFRAILRFREHVGGGEWQGVREGDARVGLGDVLRGRGERGREPPIQLRRGSVAASQRDEEGKGRKGRRVELMDVHRRDPLLKEMGGAQGQG